MSVQNKTCSACIKQNRLTYTKLHKKVMPVLKEWEFLFCELSEMTI